MKISKFIRFSIFAATAMVFVACEDDDDDDTPSGVENEEELITDMTLTFVEAGTTDTLAFTFSDRDGIGGDPATQDVIMLDDGKVYNVSIVVEDISNPNDIEDITEEIKEEDDEHQFFFVPNNGGEDALTVAYDPTDVDDDNNPIGLLSIWTTTQPTAIGGNERVRVTLRHEPNKDGENVSDGDITNAGGETDIEVNFELEIN